MQSRSIMLRPTACHLQNSNEKQQAKLSFWFTQGLNFRNSRSKNPTETRTQKTSIRSVRCKSLPAVTSLAIQSHLVSQQAAILYVCTAQHFKPTPPSSQNPYARCHVAFASDCHHLPRVPGTAMGHSWVLPAGTGSRTSCP